MSISHEICPNTRRDEIDTKMNFVKIFTAKEEGGNVRRVKCGDEDINTVVTLFYHLGDSMSPDDFEKLDDNNYYESTRKKLSLRSPD